MRLARAGRADQEHELALLDVTVGVAQGDDVALVHLGDVLELDHGGRTGLRCGGTETTGRKRRSTAARTAGHVTDPPCSAGGTDRAEIERPEHWTRCVLELDGPRTGDHQGAVAGPSASGHRPRRSGVLALGAALGFALFGRAGASERRSAPALGATSAARRPAPVSLHARRRGCRHRQADRHGPHPLVRARGVRDRGRLARPAWAHGGARGAVAGATSGHCRFLRWRIRREGSGSAALPRDEQLAPYRAQLLVPVRAWAEARCPGRGIGPGRLVGSPS